MLDYKCISTCTGKNTIWQTTIVMTCANTYRHIHTRPWKTNTNGSAVCLRKHQLSSEMVCKFSFGEECISMVTVWMEVMHRIPSIPSLRHISRLQCTSSKAAPRSVGSKSLILRAPSVAVEQINVPTVFLSHPKSHNTGQCDRITPSMEKQLTAHEHQFQL